MSVFDFQAKPSHRPDERGVEVPAQLATKAELFAFLHGALPLPAYFGHNWDALEECLGDLAWLDDPKISLVHRDIPLEASPVEQRIDPEILAGAVLASDRLRVGFPEKCRGEVERILS